MLKITPIGTQKWVLPVYTISTMKNKVLLFDLETAPCVSYHWQGMHEQEIIETIEEGYLLSFAYKFKGDKVRAYSLADFKGDKKKLVEKLHEVLNQADVLIAHSGKYFDFKWANRAFITYGLKPPTPAKTIDTLAIARSKFNFHSNHLTDLGKLFKIGQKTETGGFKLWKACMAGDKKAFKKMVEYNKNDVILLEQVYERLVPWMTNYPVGEVGMFCPKCGGDVQFRGPYQNKQFIGKRYQCKKCASWGISNKQYRINKEEYVK